MKRITKSLLWVCSVFFFLIYSWNLKKNNPRPIIKVSEQNSQINFNKNALKVLSLGQARLISSIIWVQTLMESDLEHYKNNDLNSWMYLRFDSITELDPLFYEAYLWGGIYLSIVKDDALGAAKLYEKGLQLYPIDVRLNFNTGFNYFFEIGEINKAIFHFEKVLSTEEGRNSYPRLLGLVERMKKETGTPYYEILLNLENRLKHTRDKRIRNYLSHTMYSVKATADLECLNSKRVERCSKFDLLGKAYFKNQSGKYQAQKEFKPFKIFRKN